MGLNTDSSRKKWVNGSLKKNTFHKDTSPSWPQFYINPRSAFHKERAVRLISCLLCGLTMVAFGMQSIKC
jgi:hypothetical protein